VDFNGLEDREADLGSKPEVNVLLLYEDAETGLRAKLSLAVVQKRGLLETGFRTKLWRRDLLRAEWLCEQAAKEAAAADVIIVSMHGEADLPGEVTDWLARWLEHKTDRPCALGVLLDGSAAQRPASPITRYLQGVAEAAGADLLWGFCETNDARGNARKETAFGELNEGLSRGRTDSRGEDRFAHWGINE